MTVAARISSTLDRGRARALVLGCGERARDLALALEKDPLVEVLGFLDDQPDRESLDRLGDRYLGHLDRLAEIAVSEAIDHVVFGLPRRFLAEDSMANAVGICEALGIELTIPIDLFDTRAARVVRRRLAGIPVISLSLRGQHPGWKLAIKRAIDIFGAAAALLLLSPVWIAAAIAIKATSAGPVLYVQTRCGRYGRTFSILKFRTMYVDAERRLEQLRGRNELLGGPVFKMKDDPRRTSVGGLLRKTSIDEIPQFLNVLVGQMSLVGPRPPVPSEVRQYELDHRGRLSVRPGITCLWQVSGRNEIQFEDWVKLDIEYVERWSLWLDFQILCATIPAVLSTRGAS